jgi:hypothetical protein
MHYGLELRNPSPDDQRRFGQPRGFGAVRCPPVEAAALPVQLFTAHVSGIPLPVKTVDSDDELTVTPLVRGSDRPQPDPLRPARGSNRANLT